MEMLFTEAEKSGSEESDGWLGWINDNTDTEEVRRMERNVIEFFQILAEWEETPISIED